MPAATAAAAFVDWLARLKSDLGVPARLSGHAAGRAVTAADIPALVEVAVNDICHRTNPRPVARDDFAALFAAAM